jgi:uncharacterized OsmC-like protein
MTTHQTLAEPATINGVDVMALGQVVEAIKGNPEVAKFNFRASNRWLGGDRTRSTIKTFTGALQEHRTHSPGFTVESGEPPVLLGQDKAPNPGEWLLHTLAACITTTIAYHAAARGIEVTQIESDVDGDIDLRGFLGLSAEVPKGYSALRVRMRVRTAADRETMVGLAGMSAMLEMVSRAAPVDLRIETWV